MQRALDIAILEINIEVESRRTIKTSASDLGDFSVQEQDVPDGD